MALFQPQSLLHFQSQAPSPLFNGRIAITHSLNSPLSNSLRIRSLSKDENFNSLDEIVDLKSNGKVASRSEESPMSSFDFLHLKRELEKEQERDEEKGRGDKGKEMEDAGRGEMERRVRSRRRQMVGRSSLLAKQVISVRSARSLGFVSQLWVDTNMWVVALIEVRPNLLSGEVEKFLLDDIFQVGDVVLIQDEIVLENELKLVGLDNLIGYNVVTTSRRNVGKVRGYTFNINSGMVESLELDSFGFSLVPSNLVSTYCLLIEDIVEVVSDTIIVHEEAPSRLQRLTKGILGAKSIQGRGERRYRRRVRERDDDDWDLPMSY